MHQESTRTLLISGALELGLALTPVQLDALLNYLDLLVKWNAHINLTGARDERSLVIQHLVDSLAVIRHLSSGTLRAVDVGSGGGLPAVPVAIARPDIAITALEPIHKKHAFLATVRRELSLGNLHPRAERLEFHLRAPNFQPYDVAMSRATFSLPDWLEAARGLIHRRGLILAMEGAQQHALPANAIRHPYVLHSERGRARAIVVWSGV